MKNFHHISIWLTVCFIVFAKPEKCTYNEFPESHYSRKVIQAEIVCLNVPRDLLITTIYFVEKPYPQDVIIRESIIPTVSNYTSLLNMQFVRKLTMRNLGIEHIMPEAFRNMKILEELDLSYNKLSIVTKSTFFGLVNLRILNLAANNISNVLEDAFEHLTKLDILDFSQNPLNDLNNVHLDKRVSVKLASNVLNHAFSLLK
jgi:Leucine-rich repeat (LRR) protein